LQFYNYKHTHSIELLADADAQYKFVYVDVAYGHQSDGNVFTESSLGKALNDFSLNVPPPCSLPGAPRKILPHVFVGDETFPLMLNLMRPFLGTELSKEKRIFNYQLFRAGRIVKNSFGILSAKWRVFKRPIAIAPERADKVIKATSCLHNFLRSEQGYCTEADFDRENRHGVVTPDAWRRERNCLTEMDQNKGKRSDIAKEVRKTFLTYFNNEGKVGWQDNIVFRCT